MATPRFVATPFGGAAACVTSIGKTGWAGARLRRGGVEADWAGALGGTPAESDTRTVALFGPAGRARGVSSAGGGLVRGGGAGVVARFARGAAVFPGVG